MNSYQQNPVKLFIQDIYRAQRRLENKYIYQLFGLQFKNVMLHGVVTAIYNKYYNSTNLELTDPTGSIQIYYDSTKNNKFIPASVINNLQHNFDALLASGDEKIAILRTLKTKVTEAKEKVLNFAEGSYVCVVGDIFLDDRSNRMLSAFEINVTSVQREIVWLEELKYLYNNVYDKDK